MRNLFSIAFLLLILTVFANTTPNKDDRILGEPGTLQFTLGGHNRHLNDINWSPDGSKLLTCSDDGEAIIWDAITGQRLLTLTGHKEYVNDAIWSPDGKNIVTASYDSTAIIWDASTGEKLFTLAGHIGPVLKAIWTNLLNKVITISSDETSIVWNANTGEKEFNLKGGYIDLNTYNQMQYQNKVVTFFDDTTAIWDITTGKRLRNLVGENLNYIKAVAWSPDGSKIATTVSSEFLQEDITIIWNANTGKILDTLCKNSFGDCISLIQWSPDSKKIIAKHFNSEIFVWDANNYEIIYKYQNSDIIYCLYWSPNGDRFISNDSYSLNIFSSSLLKILYSIKKDINAFQTAKWSPDGNKIAITHYFHISIYSSINSNKIMMFGHYPNLGTPDWTPDNKKILYGGYYIWDANNGYLMYKINLEPNVEIKNAKLSPDGSKIFFYEFYSNSSIRDFNTGEKILTFENSLYGEDIDWSCDGTRILLKNNYGTAVVCDAFTGNELFRLNENLYSQFGAIGIAFWSPDCSKIATSKENDSVFIFDGNNGNQLLVFSGGNKYIYNLKWSPDGKKIATTGSYEDSIAYVFDANTGNKLLTLIGHSKRLSDINWSPDGSKIVTASSDKTAIIWDAITGNKIFTLKENNSSVYIANWSPDGSRILTGGSKLIIWDAFTGNQKYQLKGQQNTFDLAKWSPDGSRILTQSSNDMTAKVWYTDINSSIEENKIKIQNKVTVFPNPTENILNIKFGQILTAPLKFEIFDMLGSSIAESYVSEGANDFQMDISNLSKGIYFLKINNEIQKIVKY